MRGKSQRLWWHNHPARKLLEVTPDDDVDLPSWGRALLVTVAGNLSLLAWDDDVGGEIAAFPVLAGQRIDVCPRRVMETTTATVILMGG